MLATFLSPLHPLARHLHAIAADYFFCVFSSPIGQSRNWLGTRGPLHIEYYRKYPYYVASELNVYFQSLMNVSFEKAIYKF